MQEGSESIFQAGAQTGPQLEIELVSSNARIVGSVNLGAYARLSDILNFHDDILTVTDGAVLTATGARSDDGAPQLDVRLAEITLVVDRSDYVPPPDSDQMVEKRAHRLLCVTDAYIIRATFFIYAGAEPVPYLRAQEPRWIPITDLQVRSLVDRKATFEAKFGVLQRQPFLATAVL